MQLKRDDDADGGFDDFGFTPGSLWQRTAVDGTADDPSEAPKYARSGQSSWFAFDPDPELDGVSSSSMTSRSFVVPRSQPTYLHFNHAYVFEYFPSEDGAPAVYLDGGEVLVQTLQGGRWTTRPVACRQRPPADHGRHRPEDLRRRQPRLRLDAARPELAGRADGARRLPGQR